MKANTCTRNHWLWRRNVGTFLQTPPKTPHLWITQNPATRSYIQMSGFHAYTREQATVGTFLRSYVPTDSHKQ